MARVTDSYVTTQPFVADPNSVSQINGATIDWANVADARFIGVDGEKLIPAGTIMARTAGGWLPRKDSGADTATGILVSPAYGREVSNDALSGYGILTGGVIYQNLLPDSVASEATLGTWIGELEVAGVGVGWSWQTYGDSRTS